VKATRFVFWLKENVPNPKEKGVLAKVHEELYGKLRNEYNLAFQGRRGPLQERPLSVQELVQQP